MGIERKAEGLNLGRNVTATPIIKTAGDKIDYRIRTVYNYFEEISRTAKKIACDSGVPSIKKILLMLLKKR